MDLTTIRDRYRNDEEAFVAGQYFESVGKCEFIIETYLSEMTVGAAWDESFFVQTKSLLRDNYEALSLELRSARIQPRKLMIS